MQYAKFMAGDRRARRVHGFELVAATAAICMCMTAAFVHAPAAHAQVSSVKIDGKTIYSTKQGVKTERVKGVSYIARTRTLTLDNVKLAANAADAVRIAASSSDTVTVVTRGTCSITPKRSGVNGIYANCKLAFEGSKLNMNGVDTAVTAWSANFGNGAYSFKNCAKTGIIAAKDLKISAAKSGTVSVTTARPTRSYALRGMVSGVSNPPERLGTIAGKLGAGTQFVHANTSYQVRSSGGVKLLRYGGGKDADLGSVKFGKNAYDITDIAAGAFNNTIGRKVTRIVLGANIRSIGADAFKGTSQLTNLNLKPFLNSIDASNFKRLLNSLVKGIDSKAFRGCGMLNGARLNVHSSFKNEKINIAVKAALTLKGLPLLAKVSK